MPTVEGLQFSYALHELPPGRVPFRRWRWELWHGATLLHAGWTTFRPQAERVLRLRAAQHGHALFGLRAPDPSRIASVPIRPGAAVRFEVGPVLCSLVPRTVAEELTAARA